MRLELLIVCFPILSDIAARGSERPRPHRGVGAAGHAAVNYYFRKGLRTPHAAARANGRFGGMRRVGQPAAQGRAVGSVILSVGALQRALPAHRVALDASREWPLSPIATDMMPQPHRPLSAHTSPFQYPLIKAAHPDRAAPTELRRAGADLAMPRPRSRRRLCGLGFSPVHAVGSIFSADRPDHG